MRVLAPALLVAFAGGLVTLQGPANARVAHGLGTLQAAFVSSVVTTLVLAAVVALAGGGFARLSGIGAVPRPYLLAGVAGGVYLASVVVAVPRLGSAGVTAAIIVGQLSAALAIDGLGLLGIARHPLTATRAAGLLLLLAGAVLLIRR